MSSKETSVYTLSAPGITAKILPRGAVLQSLVVKDKEGKERDVVVGFDEPEEYAKNRTFDGTVVGRYANRIKNGKFTIDGKEYSCPLNENGKTSLHGGNNGYDMRVWDVVSHSENSITLSLFDADGTEGYPGDVQILITYTLSPNPTRMTVRIVTLSLTKRTPIMPTTHTFWNLSGFKTPNILQDTLHIPNGKRVVEVDGSDIPTGGFYQVQEKGPHHFLDYTTPRTIYNESSNHMFGADGTGIDHAYVLDQSDDVQLQWTSASSGIRLSVKTNQEGFQIYTAKHHNGSTSVKASQKGGESDKVQKFGCIAIEPQDWIDGINQPKWGREKKQIFGPQDGACVNWTEYTLDTV